MKLWEKELREKLEIQVSDELHEIGCPPWTSITGKQGYIDYIVEFHRQMNKVLENSNKKSSKFNHDI